MADLAGLVALDDTEAERVDLGRGQAPDLVLDIRLTKQDPRDEILPSRIDCYPFTRLMSLLC